MKKLLLFFCAIHSANQLYGMIPTELPVEEVMSSLYQAQEKFGGCAYLKHAMRGVAEPVAKKVAKACALLADQQYAFFVTDPKEAVRCYHLYCYKKKSASCYTKSGLTAFSASDVPTRNYWLDFLYVEPSNRNQGLATALFLYTQHVVRQLAYGGGVDYTLSLAAEPMGVEPKLDPCALNRFYRSLGGIKEKEIFRWDGVPLMPFSSLKKD